MLHIMCAAETAYNYLCSMYFLVFVFRAYRRDVLHMMCAAETAYNYLCSMYFLVFVICAYGRDVFYIRALLKLLLSFYLASWSEITSCNKIDKTLVVYRFSGNVMTSITTLFT